MSDPLNRPRIEEPRTGVMPGAALNDWNRGDIELPQEPALPREPIFSRRVLIGWALFALVAYFGVHLIGSIIKTTVREAINTASEIGGNPPGKEIIYQTPNGKITISRDHRGGPITITRRSPTRAHPDVPPDPAAVAEAARAAAEAAVDAAVAGTIPAPATAPPAAPASPKKR